MKEEKAIKILEDHNRWRCDNNVPSKYPPTDSKKLTEAINTVVSIFKRREG